MVLQRYINLPVKLLSIRKFLQDMAYDICFVSKTTLATFIFAVVYVAGIVYYQRKVVEISSPKPYKEPLKGAYCNLLDIKGDPLEYYHSLGYKFVKEKQCLHSGLTLREDLEPAVSNSCKQPSLYTESYGRLGNQICEYISLKYFNEFFKVPITLGNRIYKMMKENFKPVREKLYRCKKGPNKNFDQIYDMLAKDYQNLTHHPVMNLDKTYAINQYPCRLDVMMDHRERLSNSVEFLPHMLQKANQRLEEALKSVNSSQDFLTVSVHVRRTDYERRLHKVFDRGLLSVCYYEQAMHHFRQLFNNVIFVMASDDIPWCKSVFERSDIVFLDNFSIYDLEKLYEFHEPEEDIAPVIDMATMSLCDHHIIGFGTFGFFGAFFSGKGLIAHSIVFDRKLVEFENELLCSTSTDLIPIADLHS